MTAELPDVEVFEVFVFDEHGHLATPSPEPVDGIDPRLLAGQVGERLREVKATPGHRIGRRSAPVIRNGLGEDICQPVLAPALSVLDRLFDSPDLLGGLPALEIDGPGVRTDATSAVWEVALQTGPPTGRRDAQLAVHASPSCNLTIIELVPRRPRRVRTKTFVRLGVAAIAELAERLRRPAPLAHPV
ncbi:MAG: hypothetical protein AAF081_07465 [Actinomycetota bacterium]